MTPAAPTVVYGPDKPMRVQPLPMRGEGLAESGDTAVRQSRYVASISWDADEQVRPNDVLVLSRSHDPQLVGRDLVVDTVTYSTFQSRRYLHLSDRPADPAAP